MEDSFGMFREKVEAGEAGVHEWGVERDEITLGAVHGPDHSGPCKEYGSGKIIEWFLTGELFHGSYLLYIIA